MSNEKLTKKLAIYHHPLFQNLGLKWKDFLGPDEENMSLITFLEINLRVQKAIMNDYNFENACTSALNDWLQEIESLTSQNPTFKKAANPKNKKEGNLFPLVSSMVSELPFEPTESVDKYFDFFLQNRQHEAFNYEKDKISLAGFLKFILDLCYSWCEELDIELFSIFIHGVLLQISVPDYQGARILKKTSQISNLSEAFLSLHKRLRTEYQRYQKVDLFDYESWYEWNYLPTRINEMKTKAKDIFQSYFPEQELMLYDFEKLYNDSAAQILQEELKVPTTKHFTFYKISEKENENTAGNLKGKDSSQKEEINIAASQDSHQKVVKKLAMPIFGKTIPKPTQEETCIVHTLKSLVSFLDPPNDEDDEFNIEQENLQGLCPIYENDTSETGSLDTRSNMNTNQISERGSIIQSPVRYHQPFPPKLPNLPYSKNTPGSKPENRSFRQNEKSFGEIYASFLSGGESKVPPKRGRTSSPLKIRSNISAESQNQRKYVNTSFTPMSIDDTINLIEKYHEQNNFRSATQNNSYITQNKDLDETTKDMENQMLFTANPNFSFQASKNQTQNNSFNLTSIFGNGKQNKETVLPKVFSRHSVGMDSKRSTVTDRGQKEQIFDKRRSKFQLFEQLSNLESKPNPQIKLKPIKPNPENLNYKWKVEESFTEVEREELIKKMNVRLERNKKRQENRSKPGNGQRKGRKNMNSDVGKRIRVFFSSDHRTLFKEVFM